jgi:hypothetical protein
VHLRRHFVKDGRRPSDQRPDGLEITLIDPADMLDNRSKWDELWVSTVTKATRKRRRTPCDQRGDHAPAKRFSLRVRRCRRHLAR